MWTLNVISWQTNSLFQSVADPEILKGGRILSSFIAHARNEHSLYGKRRLTEKSISPPPPPRIRHQVQLRCKLWAAIL